MKIRYDGYWVQLRWIRGGGEYIHGKRELRDGEGCFFEKVLRRGKGVNLRNERGRGGIELLSMRYMRGIQC